MCLSPLDLGRRGRRSRKHSQSHDRPKNSMNYAVDYTIVYNAEAIQLHGCSLSTEDKTVIHQIRAKQELLPACNWKPLFFIERLTPHFGRVPHVYLRGNFYTWSISMPPSDMIRIQPDV